MRRAVSLAAVVAALWAAAALVWLSGPPPPVSAATTAPNLKPPAAVVEPDTRAVDPGDVEELLARVADDSRGWGVDLDQYTIRIVPAGTYGTAPDNGRPGVGAVAWPGQRTAVISDRSWAKLGKLEAEAGATLDEQRIWFVNHELGHLLGHDHTECVGGGPAPVMRLADFGVGSCGWNAWPHP